MAITKMVEHTSFIKITFEVAPENQDLLLGFALTLPFSGFEMQGQGLIGYIPVQDFKGEELDILLASLPFPVSFQQESEPVVNWNAKWESEYEPIEIGDFCYIRTSFHPAKPQFRYELIINPQMSFGTGHHETTRLMIQQMQAWNLSEKRVLDMGCGTGILGILAEKMGAASVVGVDIDPLCIENSYENILLNQSVCMEIYERNAYAPTPGERFDVILANINRNVLLADIPHYASLLNEEGHLLLSGFYKQDLHLIEEACSTNHLTSNLIITENAWVALSCRKITP